MSEHSPEPWSIGPSEECDGVETIFDANGDALWLDPYAGPGDEDNQRIVAMSRALAGIEDPEAFVRAVKELMRAPHVDIMDDLIGRLNDMVPDA